MSQRKWRVIVERRGKRFPLGGGVSGRGQGTPFVSEKAARRMAEQTAVDAGDGVRVYAEEFDYVPPAPEYVSPLANPPRFN